MPGVVRQGRLGPRLERLVRLAPVLDGPVMTVRTGMSVRGGGRLEQDRLAPQVRASFTEKDGVLSLTLEFHGS